jgi:hypothetical protein
MRDQVRHAVPGYRPALEVLLMAMRVRRPGVRRNRRLLGSLVLAFLVSVGTVVVLAFTSAPEAQAFCPYPLPPDCGGGQPEPAPLPWPWPLPTTPAPWTPPPAPGGGGGGQATGNTSMVKDVSRRALAALQFDKCNQFVSGTQPESNDAVGRYQFNTIVERPNTVFKDQNGQEKPGVRASVNSTDHGTGGGTITLWKGFFDEKLKDDFVAEAKRHSQQLYNIVQFWSLAQVRAFLLLHEEAHLTGTLPGNHQGPEGAWDPNDQHGFHLKLAQACKPPS